MDATYTANILEYFSGHDTERELYEEFAGRVLEKYPDSRVKVHKTQISFYNRHLFAVAFFPYRRMKDWPQHCLLVTFGLEHRVESPRIAVATEPYPRRWTHHVVVSRPEDIDEELMGWVAQAWEFSRSRSHSSKNNETETLFPEPR